MQGWDDEIDDGIRGDAIDDASGWDRWRDAGGWDRWRDEMWCDRRRDARWWDRCSTGPRMMALEQLMGPHLSGEISSSGTSSVDVMRWCEMMWLWQSPTTFFIGLIKLTYVPFCLFDNVRKLVKLLTIIGAHITSIATTTTNSKRSWISKIQKNNCWKNDQLYKWVKHWCFEKYTYFSPK